VTQDPITRTEPVGERTVQEIQAEITTAADRLETLVGELALAPLMTSLERDHFPADEVELERIGTDEECPSVAFEVHGDLAGAFEALGEAIDGLRKAASRTTETVRAAWRERLLAKVKDPVTRHVLREVWR